MNSRLYTWFVRLILPLAALATLISWFGMPMTQAALRSPTWYDSNAVGTAPDWHYRVPITIPANTPQYSTISIDVNFNTLLTSLGVTTPFTFDNNSPRVTLADGVTLVTYQEFTDSDKDTLTQGQTDPLNDGIGNLRFIYQSATSVSATTYYLYFDITQNNGGASKTANPQTPINGNLEADAAANVGLPKGFWSARSMAGGSGWDAVTKGSESVSVTTNVAAGGGNAAIPSATVTTDGTPFTGNYSYLLGARSANEPSNSNPAVTVDFTIKNVPATCSGSIPNLRLRYRVEGWDGSANSATTRDFLRIRLLGTTNTEVIGPTKGTYVTLPFSPNLRTTAATNTQSGYRIYNGFDTDANGPTTHLSGMTATFDRGQQPWITVDQTLAAYLGQANVVLRITSSHTTNYRSWFHIDNIEWCVVTTATLGTPEGFGVAITSAGGQALSVTAQVDADATSVTANIYDGSGTLKASGVVLTKSGATWTNTSAYTFNADPTVDAPGTWTVRVFAKDWSTSSQGASYNGLVWKGSGGATPPQTSANFWNIEEATFSYVGPVGTYNAYDTTNPGWSATPPLTGYIQTKIAGTPFTLAVIALTANKTAVNASDTSTVTVELVDGSTAGTWNGATGCRASWAAATAIATSSFPLTTTLASGKNTMSGITVVNNVYKDVRARLRVAGVVVGCSTDNFALRPDKLTVAAYDSTSSAAATAGTARALANGSASGGAVHTAATSGAPLPFTLRVTALNSSGAAITGTSNYVQQGGAPTPVSGTAACVDLGGGCSNGVLTVGGYAAATSNGSVTSQYETTANYSEAGAFTYQVEDQTFANVDSTDGSSTAQRYVVADTAATVGRFVPAYFTLSNNTTPALAPFCSGGATPFTYIGQKFLYGTKPVINISALNNGGGVTSNYRSSVANTVSGTWHLNPATMLTQTYSDNSVGPGLTQSVGGVIAATGSATTASNITMTTGNGTGIFTLNSDSADYFIYTRSTTTPLAQFDASIKLSVDVSDTSEGANLVASIGTNNPIGSVTKVPHVYTPIAFTGSGTKFRFGRLRLSNAVGSEQLSLNIPIQTEYWSSNGFIRNSDDTCTVLKTDKTSFSMDNYKGTGAGTALSGSNMFVGVTTPSPTGNLRLTGANVNVGGYLKLLKPSPTATGSVDLTLNLNVLSPGEDKTWLQGAWNGVTTYTANPTARASFGMYGAQPREYIYFRENF